MPDPDTLSTSGAESEPQPNQPAPRELHPTLRQSLLASFDACALTTRFDLDHARGFSTHEQARGTIFHRVADKILAELAAQNEQKIETDVALAILHETLRQADVPDDEVLTIPMSEVADLYWMVVKFAHDNTWDVEHLASIEERLEATVEYPDPDGGFIERRITGQPDAIFIEGERADHAIVPDWKTGWAMPPPSGVSEEGFFQQRLYAFLVFENYRTIERVTLREFYPRYSEAREATVFRSRIEDIRAEVAALAERFDRAVTTDTWAPAPGKHCQYCLQPNACPIPNFAKGAGAIRSAEEAEKVAARLLVAQAAASQAQKALRGYAEVHGPVPVKDAKGLRQFGFRASTRTSRPKKEELQSALAATKAGYPLKLDDLYHEERSTRFDAHSPAQEMPGHDEAEMIRLLEESVRRV